jgi:hypothetical protein
MVHRTGGGILSQDHALYKGMGGQNKYHIVFGTNRSLPCKSALALKALDERKTVAGNTKSDEILRAGSHHGETRQNRRAFAECVRWISKDKFGTEYCHAFRSKMT